MRKKTRTVSRVTEQITTLFVCVTVIEERESMIELSADVIMLRVKQSHTHRVGLLCYYTYTVIIMSCK